MTKYIFSGVSRIPAPSKMGLFVSPVQIYLRDYWQITLYTLNRFSGFSPTEMFYNIYCPVLPGSNTKIFLPIFSNWWFISLRGIKYKQDTSKLLILGSLGRLQQGFICCFKASCQCCFKATTHYFRQIGRIHENGTGVFVVYAWFAEK